MLRSTLRWLFGVQALIFLFAIFLAIRKPELARGPGHTAAIYFCAAGLALLPSALAYLTLLRPSGRRNYFAIVACGLDLLAALPLIYFAGPASLIVLVMGWAYLFLNLAGIWLCLSPNLDGAPPEPATSPTTELLSAAPTHGTSARRPLIALAATAAACMALLALASSGYAATTLWHLRHGDTAQLASYQVKLPPSWSPSVSSSETDPPAVERMGRSSREEQANLYVLVAAPDSTPPEPSADLDERELTRVEANVTIANHTSATSHWKASLVVLHTRSFPLYCNRMDFTGSNTARPVSRPAGSTYMTCYTGHTNDLFRYVGPPQYVQEAESILTTLQSK
ncbi:MAG TPA: hypothetical protein VG714_07125 [Acidobacteriaceae bacterium]|nr:hypothetical protein [Acidobacteriaceae bacterium]